MLDFENIIYNEEDNISWIKLNRPEKLNALTKQMWEEFYESLDLAKKSDTQLIILTGIGRAFSAGDDIIAMHELKNEDEATQFFFTLLRSLESLLNIEKPVIGMVNGLAYGGGCEILLLADIVIATENSKFALPEIKLGLIPPIALSVGYAQLGIKQINRLALTGEAIDVYEAKSIGLVDYITSEDNLKNKTLKTAWTLLENAPYSIQFIKKWSNKCKIKFELNEAISELIKLSLKEESKKRMEGFINKHR